MRRGRTYGSSEESHLRNLSPTDTLRAFTEQPIPFDTTHDEYKVLACIETLTPAERDLGARVAKAAQRLKSWCQEIEQWGWSGGFEPPSEEYQKEQRQRIEERVREHVKDPASVGRIEALEYWGSLLAVEVEAHEARLDEIGDELLTLDIDELKEHVLDIHGPNRSRPSSAGYEASRTGSYTPMDDFSFLITQTLLSALPDHYRLQDRLSMWTARVTVLRDAPRFLDDLKTAQRAMELGWKAIEPPEDTSDAAFDKWKEAIDTISVVLQAKVSSLGRRLDRMLDILEGRDDRLPDDWIDVFEGVEGNYGRWVHESRKRVIAFDVRRKAAKVDALPSPLHSRRDTPEPLQARPATSEGLVEFRASVSVDHVEIKPRSVTAFKGGAPDAPSHIHIPLDSVQQDVASEPDTPTDDSVFDEGDTVVHHDMNEMDLMNAEDSSSSASPNVNLRSVTPTLSGSPFMITVEEEGSTHEIPDQPQTPRSRRSSLDSISEAVSIRSSPASVVEESPSVRQSVARRSKQPRPELNALMSKRRPLEIVQDSAIDDTPPWPPTQFSKKLSSNNSSEELDRKISDILTTIPAHIRLTSGTVPDDGKPARGKLTSKGSRGYLRATRSFNGLRSPELTLSRAKSDFNSANAATGRRSAAANRGDNDIKLYHLTQPGKEKPIKLFIRRVGENGERVMVRVGGGWADLGEYLRQYAEHHGHRTVSDGKFEIHGFEVKTLENSPRPESAMKSSPRPQSAMKNSPTRPQTAMSNGRERRFSGGGYPTSTHTTPQKSSPLKPTVGLGISQDEAPPQMPNLADTPGAPGAADGDRSTPSTDSSGRSWRGQEVGLAGPKAKKLDLSGDKLEWIEGMMKQARSVSSGNLTVPKPDLRESASGRPESRDGARKPVFDDLGKVGGTKRVFMKHGALGEH
jgi:hypothetical protein